MFLPLGVFEYSPVIPCAGSSVRYLPPLLTIVPFLYALFPNDLPSTIVLSSNTKNRVKKNAILVHTGDAKALRKIRVEERDVLICITILTMNSLYYRWPFSWYLFNIRCTFSFSAFPSLVLQSFGELASTIYRALSSISPPPLNCSLLYFLRSSVFLMLVKWTDGTNHFSGRLNTSCKSVLSWWRNMGSFCKRP